MAVLVGAVCLYAAVRLVMAPPRSIFTDVLQGALVGVGLAIVTVEVLARLKATTVNGWATMPGCGRPENGPLMRACTWMFPGPVNVPEEATYWTTQVDGNGHPLSGRRCYVMRFPAGCFRPIRGAIRVASPRNAVLLVGRVLVFTEHDLAAAHEVAGRFQLSGPGDAGLTHSHTGI